MPHSKERKRGSKKEHSHSSLILLHTRTYRVLLLLLANKKSFFSSLLYFFSRLISNLFYVLYDICTTQCFFAGFGDGFTWKKDQDRKRTVIAQQVSVFWTDIHTRERERERTFQSLSLWFHFSPKRPHKKKRKEKTRERALRTKLHTPLTTNP